MPNGTTTSPQYKQAPVGTTSGYRTSTYTRTSTTGQPTVYKYEPIPAPTPIGPYPTIPTTPPPPPPPGVSTPVTTAPTTLDPAYQAQLDAQIAQIERQARMSQEAALGNLNRRGLIRGGISGPGITELGNIMYDQAEAISKATADIWVAQMELQMERDKLDAEVAQFNAQLANDQYQFEQDLLLRQQQFGLSQQQADFERQQFNQEQERRAAEFNAEMQLEYDRLNQQQEELYRQQQAITTTTPPQQPTSTIWGPKPSPAPAPSGSAPTSGMPSWGTATYY